MNDSRILSNGLATISAQGINFALSILMVAVIQRNLGGTILGVWLTTTTFLLTLIMSDFGIGNALIALASRKKTQPRSLTATEIALAGTGLTFAVGFGLFGLLWGVHQLEAWPRLLGFDAGVIAERTGNYFLYFALYLAAMFPISVVERLQIADKKAFIPKGLQVVGGLISLPLALFMITPETTLGTVFLLRFLPHFLLRVMNSAFFWYSNTPYWKDISASRIRTLFGDLLNLGVAFFFVSIASTLAMNTDTLVIANILGVERVPEYSVPLRLFLIPTMFTGIYIAALWPAYAQAIREPQLPWIRRVFFRSLLFAVVVTLLFDLLLLGTAPQIIELWLGSPLPLPRGMLFAQATWVFLAVLGATAAPLLNAAKMERFQAKAGLWMVFLNIPISVFLVSHLGTQGAMWGTALSTFLGLTLPSYLRVYRILKK